MLTFAQGRTALRGAPPVCLGGIREHFGDILSAQELRTITSALDRVIEQARRSARADRANSSESAGSGSSAPSQG